MRFAIGVKNFAKIEEAEICVNKYTLLVGPNNSGKTFLMQLVEGVNDYLHNSADDEIYQTLSVEKTPLYTLYRLTKENSKELCNVLNKKLEKEKNNIVTNTLGKTIPIEELYINIELQECETYNIYYFQKVSNISKIPQLNFGGDRDYEMIYSDAAILTRVIGSSNEKELPMFITMRKNRNDEKKLVGRMLRNLLTEESLFMPASRNGLMLLYRELFAHKTDKTLSFSFKSGEIEEEQEKSMGLTRPVYDFLRFLQTYASGHSRAQFNDEIDFYNKKIIEGELNVGVQGDISYSGQNTEEPISLYLTSSMINEVAPLFMAITSDMNYQKLIIDEVEASLHPEKQMELVRFLNRLYHENMQFIISTHSDTFVSKINNLCILGEHINKNKCADILKELNLEENDVVDPEDLFVYEFVIQSNGKSIVREIPFHESMGYQFDLFTNSALKLYNEAMNVQEITQI